VAFCLGWLLLVIAIVMGIKNGWVDVQGRPIQRIRELQPHAEERNQRIEHLADPSRD
jgi:hypothetical protein